MDFQRYTGTSTLLAGVLRCTVRTAQKQATVEGDRMATAHLFDPTSDTVWDGITFASGFEVGTPVRVVVAGFITEVGWYRFDTVSGHAPTALNLWQSDGSLLAAAPSVPDSGAPGWQRVALTDAVPVAAGADLVVSGYWPATAHPPFSGGTGVGVDGVRLTQATSTHRVYGNMDTPGFPNTGGDAQFHAVDVTWSDTSTVGGGGGGGTGVTSDELAAGLASWLSSDPAVNTHQADGTPWASAAGIAALGLTVGGRSGRVLTLGSLVAAANYLVSHADDILGAINQFRQLVGGDAGSLSDIQTALSGTEARLSDLINSHSTRGFPPFPGAGWTMVDSIDFDTNLSWDVPADLYVATVSQYVPARSVAETAAGTWLHRLGWWCPLRGSLASSRSFFEFQEQYLEQGGRRMQGLALQCERGTLGNVQAWVLA